jgi:hypothetical protein
LPEEQDVSDGAVLVTSTNLSKTAHEFAAVLGITVHERVPLVRYPAVKCNTKGHEDQRIYHLPFDQQYDKIVMGRTAERFYVETVAEAESRGFRRAWHWRSKDTSQSDTT